MRNMLKLYAALLAVPAWAQSVSQSVQRQPTYDPTDYLSRQEYQAAQEAEAARATHAVKPANVVVGGIPYVKFEAEGKAIYVPKLTNLTREELDRSLCQSSFSASELQTATVSQAAVALTEKTRLYASVIVDTIHAKCDGGETRPAPAPAGKAGLELGVEVKEGKGRDPTTYSIFNRNLAPNIGVRADF